MGYTMVFRPGSVRRRSLAGKQCCSIALQVGHEKITNCPNKSQDFAARLFKPSRELLHSKAACLSGCELPMIFKLVLKSPNYEFSPLLSGHRAKFGAFTKPKHAGFLEDDSSRKLAGTLKCH